LLQQKGVEAFMSFYEIAARDPLMPHDDALIALSTMLRIKRAVDSAEIDKIISDLQGGKALAIEHRRGVDWHQRALSAKSFVAEYGHAGGACS
jgi:hypothetical protein